MLQIFGKVEELSLSSLRASIPWTWESFGEYMDAIDQGLGAVIRDDLPARLRE